MVLRRPRRYVAEVFDSGSQTLVLISGPVCAGKTTLATGLSTATDAGVISTRQLLLEQATGKGVDRHTLQHLGDSLDVATGGDWVAAAVRNTTSTRSIIIVDAVRKGEQVAALRALSPATHIHLTADDDVLTIRYGRLRASRGEAERPSLEDLRSDPTEAAIDALAEIADLTIDTGRFNERETLAQALTLVTR